MEQALWTALTALEESAELSRRLANRARNGGLDAIATWNAQRAADTEARAASLRELLVSDAGDAAAPAARSPGNDPDSQKKIG